MRLVCPICRAVDFKRVLVRLPSGKDRLTDFVSCTTCRIVFMNPEEGEFDRYITSVPCKEDIPTSIVEAAILSLGDPAADQAPKQRIEIYAHPTKGRIAMVFRRMRKAPGEDRKGDWFWSFDDARLLG